MTRAVWVRLLLVLQFTTSSWLPQAASFASEESAVRAIPKQPAGPKAALTEEEKIIHLLNRAGFGAKPGDVEKVKWMGIGRYLESQLHPSKIDDTLAQSRLDGLATLTMSSAELVMNYPPPKKTTNFKEQGAAVEKPESTLSDSEERQEIRSTGLKVPRRIISELAQAKVLRAAYSERQLYEVMVDFWTNHFNVFAAKGADKWLTTAFDREVIRPYAMGKFSDLLMATAKSPAMLFYLDNWLSSDPNSTFDLSKMRSQSERFGLRRGSGSFRRFEREDRTMEGENGQKSKKLAQGQGKQKRGLNENYARELMELHTLGVNGGYTQEDITEVARCFTGWTIARPRQGGEFFFAKVLHDNGEKMVLGHKITPGGGIRDGEHVLDILAHHPSTATFVATKLARRFVADEPPESLITRVAEVFRKTEGNISLMVKEIFTSREFNSPEAYRAKIKTPFELVISSLRVLNAETKVGGPILKALAEMGEPLFLCQPPTGYADRAEAWVNTGALVKRLNFGLALANNRLPGTRVNLDELTASAADKSEEFLLQSLGALILQSRVSDKTLATLRKQIKESGSEVGESEGADRSMGPAKIAGLLLGSPEFQRQ